MLEKGNIRHNRNSGKDSNSRLVPKYDDRSI